MSQRASLKIILVAIVSVLVGMMIPSKWRISFEDKTKTPLPDHRLIVSVDGAATVPRILRVVPG